MLESNLYALIDSIKEKCDDILNGDFEDTAIDFATNVMEIATSMEDMLEERGHLSGKQVIALENMNSGLDRWLEGWRD